MSFLTSFSAFYEAAVYDGARVVPEVLCVWMDRLSSLKGYDWIAAGLFDAFVIILNSAVVLGLLWLLKKLITLIWVTWLSLVFGIRQCGKGVVEELWSSSLCETTPEEHCAQA